jgi:hypothetical protein
MLKISPNTVGELLATLKDRDPNEVIGVHLWYRDDIQHRAKEAFELDLTDEQADEILANVVDEHDCTIGINWDVIDDKILDFKLEDDEDDEDEDK